MSLWSLALPGRVLRQAGSDEWPCSYSHVDAEQWCWIMQDTYLGSEGDRRCNQGGAGCDCAATALRLCRMLVAFDVQYVPTCRHYMPVWNRQLGVAVYASICNSEAAAFHHRQHHRSRQSSGRSPRLRVFHLQTAAIPLLVPDTSPRSRIANDAETGPLPIARPSHISVPRQLHKVPGLAVSLFIPPLSFFFSVAASTLSP